MRIALTADWLVTFGGAERVIAEMLQLWPEAPIFTTVHNPTCLPAYLPTRIHTSSLQRWYQLIRNHRLLIPWMPRAVESWDLSGYDVILSSSHAVAKGCIPKSPARHICYCHTPMRYAWEMEESYLDDLGLKGPLRSFVKWQFGKLRHWDRTTAKRVDLFIANSQTTQERIKRYYGRESVILHPPVDDRFFQLPAGNNAKRTFFLIVGRLVPYKRIDLLIQTANQEKFPLKIAGTGPEEAKLKRLAGPTVEFLGYIEDTKLPLLYASAKAFLFPVHEDAGIVPLEAQACGTPVIAFGKGGALDTVVEGETGLFFKKQTVDHVAEAIKKFESMEFDSEKIREHARKFSGEKFREQLREIVESTTI